MLRKIEGFLNIDACNVLSIEHFIFHGQLSMKEVLQLRFLADPSPRRVQFCRFCIVKCEED